MLSSPFTLLSLLLHAQIWTSAAEISLPSVLRGRSVQAIPPDEMRDFVPLSCNANLASASCASWSSTFGTASSHSSRITIPCGTCVTMDHAAADLQLNGGIDIIGKLVFPDAYKVNLQSTLIVVQGELQMTSTKQVTGVPDVRFTMIGSDASLTFTPIGNNANACKNAATCVAGKKAIIVAGGKVTLRGLPSNTPSWVRLYDVTGNTFNNPNTILVSITVKGKWGVGAQILITSHTRVWNEHQVRTIMAVADAAVSGYVALTLNTPILRPTTIIESADFAVEVALLSRNIVFDSGTDTTARQGGHFMIHHTPGVVQFIEGIEIVGFGQQGTLGRYPIHFHLCGDTPGSVVMKNTIRQSHQRCVVVHGTNKLRVEGNVAYDTMGHCYMTEDGIETGNEFMYNLGAQTGIPQTIIPNSGANGDETDGDPATFWMPNPTNSWVGNVAAGSESNGYWIEPKIRGVRASMFPNYDPHVEPLTLFKDNVAHSNNGRVGGIRTYVPGYTPGTTAVFDGTKIYRNRKLGIFIHRCTNIRIANTLLADNSNNLDIDRTVGTDVDNVVIIGESASYKALRARQNVGTVCDEGSVIGIDIHTWKVEGAKFSNVQLLGWEGTTCTKAASIHFDAITLGAQGLFEYYTTFSRMSVNPATIDMCVIQAADFEMVYINDSDGSMRPSTVTTASPSSLLASDNQVLSTFLDRSKCTDVQSGCYQYCTDTCYRSMRYSISGTNPQTYKLKVCQRDDHSKCVLYGGDRRDGKETLTSFTAHLPIGLEYDAVFLDANGREITPTRVVSQYEPTYCSVDARFQVTLYNNMPPESIPRPIAPAPVRPPAPAPVATAPVARPVAAPVPRPVSAPITVAAPTRPAPVPAPIATAPVAPGTAFGVVGLKLMYTPTNQLVMDLKNGTVVDVARFGSASFSIIAVLNNGSNAATTVTSLQYLPNGHSETRAPFSYCGDSRDGTTSPCSSLRPNKNPFTLTAIPFNSSGARLATYQVTFTIINSAI